MTLKKRPCEWSQVFLDSIINNSQLQISLNIIRPQDPRSPLSYLIISRVPLSQHIALPFPLFLFQSLRFPPFRSAILKPHLRTKQIVCSVLCQVILNMKGIGNIRYVHDLRLKLIGTLGVVAYQTILIKKRRTKVLTSTCTHTN